MVKLFTLSYPAGAAIGAYLIAAFTDVANSNTVGPATGPNQPLAGTTNKVGVSAAGMMVDLEKYGLERVTLGGSVGAGDPLTANAASQAVKAATGNRIIGYAEGPGVAGDIINYLCAPGVYSGA